MPKVPAMMCALCGRTLGLEVMPAEIQRRETALALLDDGLRIADGQGPCPMCGLDPGDLGTAS